MCQSCGGPKVECRNPANDGYFNAHTTTCYRKQATEQWQRNHEGKKDWRPDPGQLVYASLKDAEKPVVERPSVEGWD